MEGEGLAPLYRSLMVLDESHKVIPHRVPDRSHEHYGWPNTARASPAGWP